MSAGVAEQTTLKKGVQSLLVSEFIEELIDVAISKAAENGYTVSADDLFAAEATIRNDVFSTVLVQMRALGLVQPSDRKYAVSDKGTYWMLTPYGETRIVQIRAHRKADRGSETVTDLGDSEEAVSSAPSEPDAVAESSDPTPADKVGFKQNRLPGLH